MGLDERTRDDLKQWLRTARVYLWTFVAGGFFTFACTYYPLHRADDRKIHHLEGRLRQEKSRFTDFEGEFEAMRARIESRPDRAALDELHDELAGAMTRQSEFEQKLDRAGRKARDLEKSRDGWKAKYAKLEKSRDDLAHALIVANASLNAAEMAMEGDRKLDHFSSRTENFTPSDPGNQRGPSLAIADAVEFGPDNWETGVGSLPRSKNSALEATQAAAE